MLIGGLIPLFKGFQPSKILDIVDRIGIFTIIEIHIYIYTYMYIYIQLYTYREREILGICSLSVGHHQPYVS